MIKFDEYLRWQFGEHILRCFSVEAYDLFCQTPLIFGSYSEIINIEGSCLLIATGIDSLDFEAGSYNVYFHDVKLTLWGKIPLPSNEKWIAFPDEASPLWYQGPSGKILLAWNVYDNLMDILTLKEERTIERRDLHGRFVAGYSNRKKEYWKVPAFNEAVFVLVAALVRIKKKNAFDNLADYDKKPTIVISHDCDSLRGDDFWTQIVRAYRFFEPVLFGGFPDLSQVRWILKNYKFPRRYYRDCCLRMIKAEQEVDFRSTFYFLNGSGGRFGARSSESEISSFLKFIPDNFGVGMHYNYDTFLDEEKFCSQKMALEKLCQRSLKIGRAHYLRYDSEKTPVFLSKMGIKVDESLGFPDIIGYRAGIAGVFSPYDAIRKEIVPIKLLPLIIMDSTLIIEYSDCFLEAYSNLLGHIAKIGGIMTIVIHPGWCFNPEFPVSLGIYPELLGIAKRLGFEAGTPISYHHD